MKRFFMIALLFILLLSTGCSDSSLAEEKSSINAAQDTAEKVLEYINNKDSTALLSLFSENSQRKITQEEVEQAFDFIDGEITSHGQISSPDSGSMKNGNYEWRYYRVNVRNIESSTGHNYEMEFTLYTHNEDSGEIGISNMYFFKDSNYDEVFKLPIKKENE
ncbi:MAG: DUF5104 domain-containing protein [Oscillospiraceae bacterium]